jgi:hypothetical protein
VLCLLAAWAARADTIHLADRSQLRGALAEVILRVGDVPRAYSRSDIRAAELSDATDTLDLADGGKVEGKIVSVTFKVGEKLYAFGRVKVMAVALDPQSAAADARPARTLSPAEVKAQKRALAKNDEFCKAYAAKAGVRKALVLAAADCIRGDILAGKLTTHGQMFVRYEMAASGRAFSEPAPRVRPLSEGVKIVNGSGKDGPELIVEPFPEEKH